MHAHNHMHFGHVMEAFIIIIKSYISSTKHVYVMSYLV